jgi:hypothetical protein
MRRKRIVAVLGKKVPQSFPQEMQKSEVVGRATSPTI